MSGCCKAKKLNHIIRNDQSVGDSEGVLVWRVIYIISLGIRIAKEERKREIDSRSRCGVCGVDNYSMVCSILKLYN